MYDASMKALPHLRLPSNDPHCRCRGGDTKWPQHHCKERTMIKSKWWDSYASVPSVAQF